MENFTQKRAEFATVLLFLRCKSAVYEKNTLLNHEIVMASSDKVISGFISKMKKEGRIVKIAPVSTPQI